MEINSLAIIYFLWQKGWEMSALITLAACVLHTISNTGAYWTVDSSQRQEVRKEGRKDRQTGKLITFSWFPFNALNANYGSYLTNCTLKHFLLLLLFFFLLLTLYIIPYPIISFFIGVNTDSTWLRASRVSLLRPLNIWTGISRFGGWLESGRGG